MDQSKFLLTVILCGLLLPVSVCAKLGSTVDHAKLKALQKEFATPEEVTEACLSCHNQAGKQFKKTIHWRWEHDSGNRKLGKKYVINNF